MAERIKEHPILGVQEKGASVKFTFDGKEMEGMEGTDRCSIKSRRCHGSQIYKKGTQAAWNFLRDRKMHRLRYGCGWSAKRADLYHTVKGRNGYKNTVWCQ